MVWYVLRRGEEFRQAFRRVLTAELTNWTQTASDPSRGSPHGIGTRPDEGRPAPVVEVPEHHAVVRELFREHNRALLNFLRTRLRSEQEARDVAQEAYVKLLQLHKPGAVSFLRGYLFRIAANLSVDRVRRHVVAEKAVAGLFDDFDDVEALDNQAITRQEFDLLCVALNELSSRHREAFVRHIIEGYSTPEVAQEMGVDERTVRKFVARALLHCRERLGASRPGERE